MDEQHSPGPWRVSEDDNDVAVSVRDAHGELVARGCYMRDARLISRAPQLLQFAQEWLELNPSHGAARSVAALIRAIEDDPATAAKSPPAAPASGSEGV
jgi:hypothetical protein